MVHRSDHRCRCSPHGSIVRAHMSPRRRRQLRLLIPRFPRRLCHCSRRWTISRHPWRHRLLQQSLLHRPSRSHRMRERIRRLSLRRDPTHHLLRNKVATARSHMCRSGPCLSAGRRRRGSLMRLFSRASLVDSNSRTSLANINRYADRLTRSAFRGRRATQYSSLLDTALCPEFPLTCVSPKRKSESPMLL